MTTITKALLGTLPCGMQVDLYTLKNAQGAYAEIATYGGAIVRICVPDKNGVIGDVTLGYDHLEGLQHASGFMGKLIGRYGNRIGGASFELNGKTYELAKNNGENALHGGLRGFDKYVWNAEVQGEKLVLTMESPDGDENYPGTLQVKVTYTFTDENTLGLHYEAVCDQDTPINLTNHVYFNLSGPACESVCDHRIQIEAERFTAVSSKACIPNGELSPVEGTPFDLRWPRMISEGLSHIDKSEQMQFGNGYDHNFVVAGWDGTLRRICTVWDDASGRYMETWTDQPGVQFYGGNNISGSIPGKEGVPYRMRQGLCLETQHFPDSVHHPHFPNVILRAGEKYDTVTEYRFFAE